MPQNNMFLTRQGTCTVKLFTLVIFAVVNIVTVVPFDPSINWQARLKLTLWEPITNAV